MDGCVCVFLVGGGMDLGGMDYLSIYLPTHLPFLPTRQQRLWDWTQNTELPLPQALERVILRLQRLEREKRRAQQRKRRRQRQKKKQVRRWRWRREDACVMGCVCVCVILMDVDVVGVFAIIDRLNHSPLLSFPLPHQTIAHIQAKRPSSTPAPPVIKQEMDDASEESETFLPPSALSQRSQRQKRAAAAMAQAAIAAGTRGLEGQKAAYMSFEAAVAAGEV